MYTNFVCEINEIPFTKICLERVHFMHFPFFMHFHKHYTTSSISTCMFKFLDLVHTKVSNTNPKRSILHQYYTRSKVRVMAEDQAHFEWLEKAHLELQEKHTKSCDDISQMMKMLKLLTREKQNAKAPNPQT